MSVFWSPPSAVAVPVDDTDGLFSITAGSTVIKVSGPPTLMLLSIVSFCVAKAADDAPRAAVNTVACVNFESLLVVMFQSPLIKSVALWFAGTLCFTEQGYDMIMFILSMLLI